MEKVKLKWSKKEKDWEVHYPNRNGRIIGRVLCRMITSFEEESKKDWQGNPTNFTTFYDYLLKGGYDPNSFTITVKMLPNSEQNVQASVATEDDSSTEAGK